MACTWNDLKIKLSGAFFLLALYSPTQGFIVESDGERQRQQNVMMLPEMVAEIASFLTLNECKKAMVTNSTWYKAIQWHVREEKYIKPKTFFDLERFFTFGGKNLSLDQFYDNTNYFCLAERKSSFYALKRIELCNLKGEINDDMYGFLSGLFSRVKSIHLKECELSLEKIKIQSKADKLEDLELSDVVFTDTTKKESFFNFLSQFENLTSLHLKSLCFSTKEPVVYFLTYLRELPHTQLKLLKLECPSIESKESEKVMKKSFGALGDDVIRYLEKNPSLRRVSLDGVLKKPSVLKLATTLKPKLINSLDLSNVLLSRDVFEQFGVFKNLLNLSLKNCGLTYNEKLWTMPVFDSVVSLTLSNENFFNKLPGESIVKLLRGFPSLKMLDLSGNLLAKKATTIFSNENIDKITSQLTILKLSGNNLESSFFKMRVFKSLEYLDISNRYAQAKKIKNSKKIWSFVKDIPTLRALNLMYRQDLRVHDIPDNLFPSQLNWLDVSYTDLNYKSLRKLVSFMPRLVNLFAATSRMKASFLYNEQAILNRLEFMGELNKYINQEINRDNKKKQKEQVVEEKQDVSTPASTTTTLTMPLPSPQQQTISVDTSFSNSLVSLGLLDSTVQSSYSFSFLTNETLPLQGTTQSYLSLLYFNALKRKVDDSNNVSPSKRKKED